MEHDKAQRWVKELRRFLPMKSQFVLSGNIRDYHLITKQTSAPFTAPIMSVLRTELSDYGYGSILRYDPVTGFQSLAESPLEQEQDQKFMGEIGLSPVNGTAVAGIDLLAQTIGQFVDYTGSPAALVIDFASRLVLRSDGLSEREQALFTHAQVKALQAVSRPYGSKNIPFFNTIIWIVEKESDLPDWFLLNSPPIHAIALAKPDNTLRHIMTEGLVHGMHDARTRPPETLAKSAKIFAEQTDDMLLTDLISITDLSRAENVPVERVADAVRRYKVGVLEDPWQKIDKERIGNANEVIGSRLKGQERAKVHVLDIIKRAITSVGTARHGRPRGVAFLAGPTGVGKTELAKAITELLFGDEAAYIRFDMSEFSAEHADQRLLGAPPGYLGHDTGGELTNAIKERPFSIVLFDEIEKAHPRVLDKFLQILDDGVLTSGRGERVYFSESLILFTSNLGIFKTGEDGLRVPNVSLNDPYEVVETKVRGEIASHFQQVLNRPELLNRLGENIIVFDWIRPEIGLEIFSAMVDKIFLQLAEDGTTVILPEEARLVLQKLCLEDLSHGGRGIRNKLEIHLVNPLARVLFDIGNRQGKSFEIRNITVDGVTQFDLVLVDGGMV